MLELEQKLRDFDRYKQENESLREFAGVIETQRDFEYEFAQVIARDPDNLFYTFTVDKGSVDGIKRYDAVITPDGLAGIITEVGLTYSKVTSILDELTPIGAVVSRTRDLGLLESDSELREQGLCPHQLPAQRIFRRRRGYGGDLGPWRGFPLRHRHRHRQGGAARAAQHLFLCRVSPAVDFTNIRYCMVIRPLKRASPPPGSPTTSGRIRRRRRPHDSH